MEEMKPKTLYYTPMFPVLMAQMKMDLPVDDIKDYLYRLAADTRNYHGGFSTYFTGQPLLDMPGYNEIITTLSGVGNSFGSENQFEFDPARSIFGLWGTVMWKGSYRPSLRAARMTFAGVINISADENAPTHLLHNPTSIYRSAEPFKTQTAIPSPHVAALLKLDPKPNLIQIFPAWMDVEVEQNKLDVPRVFLEFAVMLRPAETDKLSGAA